MRAIDLEARVLAAVDQIRAGGSVESDFIECKREWPQDKKARQLAGSLNRAGGDPVIYIVGIDEKTGEIFDVGNTEVSNWWTQLAAKFDQVLPEMVRHMSVPVGDGGQVVVAAAFASDRAPYVVKTGLQDPNLEIPMREGTRTRTARRDELLRLLIPTMRLPKIVVLEATIYSEYYPPVPASGTEEDLSCSGRIRIYVEHDGNNLVTLPAHGMRGRVTILDEKYDLEVVPPADTASVPTGPTNYSFQRPGDGVSLTGPRAVPLQLSVQGISSIHKLMLVSTDTIDMEIELEVLHAVRPLKIGVTLDRVSESSLHKTVDANDMFAGRRTAGSWSYRHTGLSIGE